MAGSSPNLIDFYQRPDKPLEEYTTKELGREGEVIAAMYLRHRGYTIIESNWHSCKGEVDIVALDETERDPEVVLVEVKTRLDLDLADFDRPDDAELYPELAVNEAKQKRYQNLALLYLAHHPEIERIRFDVVAVSIVGDRKARLRHLANAYWWDDRP